ncbi:saccharopine dehydrogenase NADP binding domain-containing protein [Trichoderma breve]|uniref:Saccharopine dehydrogenase NADP binding domain-containing protein n=1 Tax=Trichoderma breve TaxID=2034170 RepID=A0A9W9BG67_9HYPO|nr:saccharopine dehydrogenase NADP binding domain-containing protein [Trichoderma breve]KAJ4858956.1 saccharopine dehydrogenase NADP binding domain-containing protein [Trichoderma breve]
MPFKEHDRQYDLVVFGATGYTGRLAAEYITANFPVNLKWAIAGRSESKLQAIVDDCKKLNSDRNPPAIETAGVDSYDEMSALANKTFVMITTVGPYTAHGEYAVKACAEAGTHYFDVTGETPWVYRMIKKYEKTAKESGAILIPQMGLESAPADLCTWSLAQTLRKQLSAKTRDVIISIYNLRAAPSGGTVSTVLTIFDHFTLSELAESGKPFALSPIFGVHYVPNLGTVTTAFTSSADQGLVERSWGLLSEIPSRKDEFYGPNFHWAECYRPRNWLYGVIVHWIIVIGVFLIATGKPVRTLFRNFVPAPGTGPSKGEMEKEEVEWRGIANPDTELPADRQAFCRAWYYGSMYSLTAMLCSEAARTVLEDDLELDGGFYTPCCLGQGIVDRAHNGGFKMETRIQYK